MKARSDAPLFKLLSSLVTFRTCDGALDEAKACFDYINSYLAKRSMLIELHNSDGFPSLFATSKSTVHPKVLLQAHLDVVPAHPNFYKLSEKAGKLYGRGVFDMKFAAACYLQLIDDLKDDLHNYDFGIMFTSDEEIGGENGVSYLLNKGYSADVCILPDGGNDWQIETSCNAVWIVRLTANGKSAHGSRPWEGTNAINNLVKGLNAIQATFGELKPFNNSITISRIHGGSAMNQVPDQAEAIVDMRFINDREYSSLSKKIKKIAKVNGLQLETVAYVEARNVDITQSHISSFLAIAEKQTGKQITKTHSFGASDACYFADHNIPTIVLRPNGGGAHSDHEWIDKEELLKFYKVVKAYIERTTKI